MVMTADKKSSLVQIAQATLDEVVQSVKVTIASGTITLPPGLATEAKQDVGNASLSSIDTKVATAAKQDTGNTSLSSIDGKLASLGQKAMAGSMPVALASDQTAIPASQSGTWTIVGISGTVSLPTGASTEAKQDSTITELQTIKGSVQRLNSVTLCRNVYSTTSVTTGAYVQLIASMPAAVKEVEIFDSSGETLVLAVGGAGSEADKVYVFPGGNGRIPLQIAASARLSIKAVSNNATSGEFTANFYG